MPSARPYALDPGLSRYLTTLIPVLQRRPREWLKLTHMAQDPVMEAMLKDARTAGRLKVHALAGEQPRPSSTSFEPIRTWEVNLFDT